jgi:hypothetical protein
MKFSEYAREKEQKKLIEFLIENNVDLSEVDIVALIESGWWDSAKRGLRTGALLAAMPAISGANWSSEELPNPQPYSFSTIKLMDNEQSVKDQQADNSYIAAGGRAYKQTLEDAKEYYEFQKTKENQEILKKAGLPSNYIPSNIRHFVYGQNISTFEELSETAVTVIQDEVRKHFGRDMFVRFVKSEDSVTGGAVILLDIEGTVMAFDENDAVKRVEVVVREIAKNKGYSLVGFQDLSKHNDTAIKPAHRSTIDFVQQESAGKPIKVKVRMKMMVSR